MKIPITFDFQGKTYSGYFSAVSGAANTSLWHLMIDGYYYGQLFKSNYGWQFGNNPKSEGMKQLAEWFGERVENGMKERAS